MFVVSDAGSTDDFTAYTGVKNAPSITAPTKAGRSTSADTYYKSGKMITVMFIFPCQER